MTDRTHNGQPPLPLQPPPPLDPRRGSSNDQKIQVCRKFVWGTCKKYHECKFRHELIFEEMKDILVFCHDYQNNVPCSKSVCTYLHASSDEEALFYATGVMPRVLVERHAAIAAAAPMAAVSPIFRNDMYGASALPPPPPPLGAPPSGTAAPPLATPLPPPVTPVMLMPPPPPPPRTQPSSVSTPAPTTQQPQTNFRPQAQHTPYPDQYSTHSLPTQSTMYATATTMSPTQRPLKFDPTRPPPPLPREVAETSGSKRKNIDSYEAGPSKSARTSPNRLCPRCSELNKSLSECKKLLEDMLSEEADCALEYSKKSEIYENRKRLVLSLLSPEHQRTLEEFIEGVPMVPSAILGSFGAVQNRAPQSLEGASVFLKLLNFALDGSRRLEQASVLVRDVEESSRIQNLSGTVNQDDEFMQLLRAVNSKIATSPDLSQQLRGIVQNYPITSEEQYRQEANMPNVGDTASNGYNNGRYQGPVAGPSRGYAEQPAARLPAPSYPAYHPPHLMPPPPVTYAQSHYAQQQQYAQPHYAQSQYQTMGHSAQQQRQPPPPQPQPRNNYPNFYQNMSQYSAPYQ